MDSRQNTAATASLVCAVSLVVCYFVGMCVGMIPFVGLLALFLMPIEWILAIVGSITGILGYRASKTMDGSGSVAGLTGAVVCGGWIILQLMVWGMVFVLFAGTLVFTLMAAVIDSM